MKILAIETSCDETAAAVVERDSDGSFIVHANVIASQIKLHQKYGGVVPEVASRAHIESMQMVVDEAVEGDFSEISAIAVTTAPGLIGALLVGVNYAKALAFTLGVPLIPVHHIEGHICANYIENEMVFPHICLVVSGGHSNIVLVKAPDEFESLASTRDDAAGEAFDKVARVLGLGYPGGPAVENAAKSGDSAAFDFPRVVMPDSDDFSFSGVKTAVINAIHRANQKGETLNSDDVAASFQQAVCDVLVSRTIMLAKKHGVKAISIAGGVAANTCIRVSMQDACDVAGFAFHKPSMAYCTDNAAMIAVRAFYSLDKREFAGNDLNARATLKIGERI